MKKTTIMLALALAAAPLAAMEKPRPGQLEAYKADGTLAARQAFAKKIGNNRFAPGAVSRLKRSLAIRDLERQGYTRAKAASMVPPSAWKGLPTTGTPKMFVLLIDFTDYAHTNSSTTVNTQIFGAGAGGYPYESLTNFYTRSSYGLLTLGGATLGWYNPGVARTSITQTTAGREGLIEQAINYFDLQGHDFSQYDNDGDGEIEYFAVIWTGPDNGWANFWWGYQTWFTDTAFTIDGKTLAKYSWQWESNPTGGAFDPLVLIHETGHALGLPDYYDYDITVGPQGGVGGLDMMDSNWGDHNAFSKFMLDWLTPVNAASGALAGTLREADAYPDAVKLMPDSVAGQTFAEYFMAQNRGQANNDTTYPSSGLLIWHVDARLDGTGTDFLYDNSYTAHKLLRLMEADGLEEIEAFGTANAGDYYGSSSSFGPATAPNSNNYNGDYTGVYVGNIAGTAASRTFDYFVMSSASMVKVTDNLFRPLKGGSCKLDVTALRSGNMSIKIYTPNGDLVRTLYDGPVAAGPATYTWNGAADGGRTAASGMYLVQVRGPGVGRTEKVVLIK